MASEALAELALAAAAATIPATCPFSRARVAANEPQAVTETPELALRGNTHVVSEEQAAVLADVGGGERIREFCAQFYRKAFVDETLSKFLFQTDGPEAHGKRLGDWIVEKYGGEGRPWHASGRWGQRQPSHHAAWNNPKRDASVRGQHFKLDDARIWVRLHFWAAREAGLAAHEPFWELHIELISHFVAVYDRAAVGYVERDAGWSASAANTERYLSQPGSSDGTHAMRDLIGIGRTGW